MTTIYIPQSAEGFEFCHPAHQEDFETLNVMIDGTPRSKTWQSPAMNIIRDDEGEKLAESDSPWLGSHALIFRRQALSELEALLLPYGELLPIECSEANLLMFNVTKVINALDERTSRTLRFSNGRIMRVTRYEFFPNIISGVDIFKIPSLRVSPTFVSSRFVERVKSAGLRGLVFNEVWSG